MPGFDARKILERQAGEVGERQDAGDAEIGVSCAIADEPVRGAEMLFQNGRRGGEFVQSRLHHVLPHRADCIALLGYALEMDLVAGSYEIPIAPAYPANDVGKGIAERPEVGFGQLREPACDRVRLPQRPVPLDQYGNALVGIELEKPFSLLGLERRSKFKFDCRFQETRRGHREARIIVAAEIELHSALLRGRSSGFAARTPTGCSRQRVDQG